MKTFLVKVLAFFVLLFGIDRISGVAFSYMSEHSKGGLTEHNQYLMNKTKENVLVFGSSRAIHHYNPQIISDSLGMSCYNCGLNGEGIIFYYGLWKNISKRYHPQIVIYDLYTTFDLIKGEDNHKFLGWLKESYNNEDIKSIFESVDPTEKYKMLCQMYRYNSKFHQVIGDFIYPIREVKKNGFIPLKGEVDSMRIDRKYNPYGKYQLDSLKLHYLKKLVNEIGKTKLFIVVSPTWYGFNREQLEPVLEICRDFNIPLIDLSNDEAFLHNDSLFKDGTHLNSLGADLFTKKMIESIEHKLMN